MGTVVGVALGLAIGFAMEGTNIKGKSQKEMMLYMMQNMKTAKAKGITFSGPELSLLMETVKKYSTPEEEDKMTQLRRLDATVTQKSQAVSLVFGIIGALLLGLGMSLAMTNLGEILGSYKEMAMLLGIIIGIIGIVLVCVAYPIYNRIVKKEREKIAPEIIRLTDELIK